MAGIVKLYDEFTLLHGKCVSKRAFEAKLNQITTGKQKCPITGVNMQMSLRITELFLFRFVLENEMDI
jgi:hypothetical protein